VMADSIFQFLLSFSRVCILWVKIGQFLHG